MTTNISTIRPGLLVAIKTSVTGNVQYSKRTIESERLVDGKTAVASWETERTIADIEEHNRAGKARCDANNKVRRVCAFTAFGHLCPEDKADELKKAIEDARAIVDEFNSTATITRIHFYVIAGRVASDDVEAAKAIRGEMASVISNMEDGVAALDPAKIREAASKAKELAQMLTDGAKYNVELAVTAARSAATAITKAVKAGEAAALAVDRNISTQLNGARLAFLDMEEQPMPPVVQQPKARARAIDLEA